MALAFALAALAACSATKLPASYRRGDKLARAGDTQAALASYRQATRDCKSARDCVMARRRVAETLVALGRRRAALAAYRELARQKVNIATAARASQRVGLLLLALGRGAEAAEAWRGCLRSFAKEAAALSCLADLVRWVRSQNKGSARTQARAVLAELIAREPEVRGRDIGANVLWRAAELYRAAGQLAEAVKLYDALVAGYKKNGLRDDALFFAGKLLEKLGKPEEALRRYRRVLVGRKETWFVGSYYSQWMDDAQLRIGRIYLETLKDLPRARAALTLLARDFPHSLLRDDALLWLAEVEHRAGHKDAACKALAEIPRRFPDGNCRRRAAKRAAALGCSGGRPH